MSAQLLSVKEAVLIVLAGGYPDALAECIKGDYSISDSFRGNEIGKRFRRSTSAWNDAANQILKRDSKKHLQIKATGDGALPLHPSQVPQYQEAA